MYDLYTWKTANSQKANIAVRELDLEVEIHPIDIGAGQQRTPEYLAINPNNKVPALHDRQTGMTLMESGAILLYLAERTGRLMPKDERDRWDAIQWIFWQMAGLGPMAGQLNYFAADPERGAHATERFRTEVERLFRVLDGRLEGRDFIANTYSMADICVWPWISRYPRLGIALEDHPNILRWYVGIAQRPAVLEGVRTLQPEAEIPMPEQRPGTSSSH